jgi:hypothetical protein
MMAAVSAPSDIGRLRVERRLGAGGFASVWLARDPELDAPVAVKILADNWAQDADVRRRFTDEARLLRRVDSDHLVRVYDVGELPDGRPYFVMTYADRGTLAEALATHASPWPPAEVLRIVGAIAAGLAVLHGHGVVHRDLTPRNVLLRSAPEGPPRVLLGDLGIAKDLHWASGITMPAGSDGYMAPEQREYSAQVSPASDVHALAMTAAQLLGVTGPPWPPTPLGGVLAAATARDPNLRTSSALGFAAALREAVTRGPLTGPPAAPLAGTPGAGAGPQPGPRSGPGPSPLLSRRGLLAAGAAVAVVAATATAGRWWIARDHRLVPSGGHVQIAVPHDLTRLEAVPFPGGTDGAAGARARAAGDPRTVAVAWSSAREDPGAVLGRTVPAGCGQPGTVRQSHVGDWTGLAVHYPGCPDGTAEDDVALSPRNGAAGPGWTVWVQVRSLNGRPDLTATLASLDVTP